MKKQFGLALVVYALALAARADGLETAQGLVAQLDGTVASVIGVMAVELALRLKKTENPQSLLYLISNIFKLIGKVCDYGARTLDQVIQRTKTPQ